MSNKKICKSEGREYKTRLLAEGPKYVTKAQELNNSPEM